MTPQIVFMAVGFLVRRYFNFIRRNDLRMSPARSIHEPSSIKNDVSELSFLDEENGPLITTSYLESLSWSVCLGVKKNFFLDFNRGYNTLFRSSLHLQAYPGSFQQRHWHLAKLSSLLFSSIASRHNRFPQRSLSTPNWTGYVSPFYALLY